MPRKRSTQLKWNRAEAGSYQSTNGKWTVQSDDGMWFLFNAETQQVFSDKQKKPCQEAAQSMEDDPPKATKTPPRRPGKTVVKATQAEKLEKAVEDTSMASLMTTLYLEVSGLKWSLERMVHSVEAVESALQKIVDPDKKMNRKQG